MDPISAVDARDRLDVLLDEVERGEEVVITRGGKTIARLVPARSPDPNTARAAASLRALRAGLAAEGVRVTAADLKELRGAGRRSPPASSTVRPPCAGFSRTRTVPTPSSTR